MSHVSRPLTSLASCLLSFSALLPLAGPAATVTVSPKGAPKCEIVTPFLPSKEVLDGARELREHIARITGEKITITTVYGTIPGRFFFYVGVNDKGEKFAKDAFAAGETLVDVAPGRVVLAGDPASGGTRLAVCRFLYDACGVRWSENPNLPPDIAKSDKLVLPVGVTREGAATAKDARAVSIDARTRLGTYKVRVTSASPEGVTVSRVANVKTALPPLGGADILAGRPFSVTPNGLYGLDKKKGETHAAFKAMTTEPGFMGFWNAPFPKDGIVYRCDVPVKALRSLRVLTTEQMRSLFFFDLVGWRNGERVTLAKGVSFPDRALNDNTVWDVSFDRAHAPKDLDAIGWVERFDEAGIKTTPRYIRVFATEW